MAEHLRVCRPDARRRDSNPGHADHGWRVGASSGYRWVATSEVNQASEALSDDEVERIVVDLVCDLAAYGPHAKVMSLEGATESSPRGGG
jgi:hypothetical protein